jgi:DNA-binding Xre family transcriptional regulator
MIKVVTNTTTPCKPPRCLFSNAVRINLLPWRGMAKDAIHKMTRIREWRLYRGMSLDALAAEAQIDKGNLSKMERGILPYNQDTLERIAAALDTDAASLLVRSPSANTAVWAVWDNADEAGREQIERVLSAFFL